MQGGRWMRGRNENRSQFRTNCSPYPSPFFPIISRAGQLIIFLQNEFRLGALVGQKNLLFVNALER